MPSEELVFRDYRPQDQASLIALLGQGRPPRYVDEKQAAFNWQFVDNPQLAGRSPFIIGVLDDDIVAVHGLIPVRARLAGQVVEACWSVDVYVSSGQRGRGLGRAVVGQGAARAPVMLVFGISDMSDPIFDKGGWVADDTMTTLFFHANETGLKGFVKNLVTRCNRVFRLQHDRRLLQLVVERSLPDDELDALWQRIASHYPNAVERDAAYLGWRYRRAPVLRYRWVAVRKAGQVHALVITRHHAVESVIADYVGPLDDPDLLATSMEFACQDLLASGTKRIRCETNHAVIRQALCATGFRRFHTPGRFRMRVNAPAPNRPSGPWFVMTGDSDNDLLVL